jgi:hypothetical protein
MPSFGSMTSDGLGEDGADELEAVLGDVVEAAALFAVWEPPPGPPAL